MATFRGSLRAAALLGAVASASAFLGSPAIAGNRAPALHRTSLSPHPLNPHTPGLRDTGRTALAATRQQLDTFHAKRLRDRGFTVLPEPAIDAALIQHARSASTSTLSRLLSEVPPPPTAHIPDASRVLL